MIETIRNDDDAANDDNAFQRGAATPLTPVSATLADMTFRLDSKLLAEASGYAPLGAIKDALDRCLAQWNREQSHLDDKRRAALDIVIGHGAALGDKAMSRCLHDNWTEEHRRVHGDPPSPRTVRYWASRLRAGGAVPSRDYSHPPKRRRGGGSSRTARPADAGAGGMTGAPEDHHDGSGTAAATPAAAERPRDLTRAWRRRDRPSPATAPSLRRDAARCPRVGEVVQVSYPRRYLGRTFDGRHAFCAVPVRGAAGVRRPAEILKGSFGPTGDFTRQ